MLTGILVDVAIGVLCIVLGISHTRGNLSTLHSYHRNRVSPENILPFGRQVGLGMILVGVGILLMGLGLALSWWLGKKIFDIIGMVLMFVFLIIGSIIAFRAMIKYNGGIF